MERLGPRLGEGARLLWEEMFGRTSPLAAQGPKRVSMPPESVLGALQVCV